MGCGLVALVTLVISVIWTVKAWSSGDIIEIAIAVFIAAAAIAIFSGLDK